MKKSILCYIFALSIVLGMNMSTIIARAQSPELKSAASNTETTEIWKISTERSSKQSEEPKVYSYYNLKLQNNRELSNVMLEGYRTSEKNQTKLALFTPVNIGTLPNNRDFTFDNFLLSTNAKEAEFVVSWEEKGRKVKQNFVFNKNHNLIEVQ
ncbi:MULTISPECIES: hypothetical protein [Peribacillus]|uniref:hypothetical protein n=1 Tax=Peribacillus TaxID=2675229 RepID=UPI001F4E7DF6|nr:MULTISPECIES: hypothetical protein [unclassified Peribacillus]MCK1981978.1 hypothetical protein [Peribacillus sp. Aquil_B1]MCK2007670.1 hypothetical protein [Peribacillus sp. Aquil_B8]